jgi:hypothetical protein
LWAQLGERIRPEEGRFSTERFGKGARCRQLASVRQAVCADFVGLHDDVARAEGTNGWISDRT